EEFKLTHEYKCHYLGEFSINTDSLILTFSPNNYFDVNSLNLNEYSAVVGMDLGHNDATAITVGLFHTSKSEHLILPYSVKRSGLDIEEAMLWLMEVVSNYSATGIYIDGADKQGVEYMRKRFPIPMVAADKRDKGTFLRALQSDITMKRILVDPKTCVDLLEECSSAIWDEKKKAHGHLIEDERCPVDCIDSFLYMWRHAYHYNYVSVAKKPKLDQDGYWDTYWEEKVLEMQVDENLERVLYGY
ncbi:MAG: hypothetical protein ACO2ZP_08995, partial [Bacteriovoracaceae bacterium]